MNFISKDFIKNYLTFQERFHDSHGCDTDDFLGAGMLYYTIAYIMKAKCCVCLGSGSGFVPRLMRQAQMDLGIAQHSQTILIDAEISGWGDPDYHGKKNFFTENWKIRIIKAKTVDAPHMFAAAIDYLHIDADHSYEHVKEDFETYFPLVRPNGMITFHDSTDPKCGVMQFLEELRGKHEFVNLPIGNGTAMLRKK